MKDVTKFNIIYVIKNEESLNYNAIDEFTPKADIFGKAENGKDIPFSIMSAKGTLNGILREGKQENLDIVLSFYDICVTSATKKFVESFLKSKNVKTEYFERKGKSELDCYNEAIEKADENVIMNFTKSTAFYRGKQLGVISTFLKELNLDMATLTPLQWKLGKKKGQLVFKDTKSVLDLSEEPYKVNFCLPSVFINSNIIGGIRFDTDYDYNYNSETFFLTRVYEKAKKYTVLKGKCFINEFLPTDPYNYAPEFERRWYTEDVIKKLIPFIAENQSSVVRQAAVVFLVQVKFWANGNDRNKSVLSREEVTEFFEGVKQLFSYIDDDVLVQYKYSHRRILARFMCMYFLKIKYKDYTATAEIVNNNGEKEAVYNDVTVENIEKVDFKVAAINYENGNLSIDGELTNVYFIDHSKIALYAQINGAKIYGKYTGIYNNIKYFGITVKKGCMFRVEIPYSLINTDSKLKLFASIDGNEVLLSMKFLKIQSRLTNAYTDSYWRFGDLFLKYNFEEHYYYFLPYSLKNRMVLERKFTKQIGKHHITRFRFMYFITKPFHKKLTFITFDQLFKGGDNGEYFFKYVNDNHKKDVNMYYILNKDAKEYKTLQKKYNRVLNFGSKKSVWKSLHADIIFATRVDVRLYCGFTGETSLYFRDLFDAEITCLQHGLSIQKIAQYQNRLFDNTKFYYCVSPYEIKNISSCLYGYKPDMLVLTGAPRYDGLAGEVKRQIIIAPTWRRNVVAGTNEKGSQHKYSVNFKNTEYFKIYNTLINDKRLIECAQKTNYKIIYLIHPILSPQIGDFGKNDCVEIRPGSDVNYETILKESSLMVTDYSGIQFDFAYQRKPLAYYHPDTLPPQYEEGGLTYDTMGFGPVCKNNDEIVNAICNFMETDCRLQDKYRERIEDFFPFSDQQNCKRVWDETVKWWNGTISETKRRGKI